ncbi:MAG: TRAP transporter substrate-binding protein [Syntrophorhabdales bacterium]|jgi:TRAP-type C4-dicarboxylate transport system substrate-binding protein
MKNRVCVKLIILIFVGSLALTAYPAAAEQVITLRYAHFMPPITAQAINSEQWCKEVEKRTNGRVKIDFYAGSTLTPASQTYDSVVNGIADIGWSILSYTRGKFPLTEVIDLPLGYKSGYVATKLINAYYEKFRPKEFDETKVLYLHAHGPGILTTSRKPVYKLEDLKGMKIRSTGLSAKIAQTLGAVPVGMPITETYDALRTGVTEGVLIPVEALRQWKLAEVTEYTTEDYGSAYSTGFFCVMNKNKWNSLPPDVQKTIEAVNQEWIERTGHLWDSIDSEGRKWALKQGHKFIPLSKEEDARWSERVRPIFDDYAKTMKQKELPGDQALKFCLDYLKANQK